MSNEAGERTTPPLGSGGSVKRRGLLRLGTLASAITGAFALSGLSAGRAEAAAISEKELAATYVPKWKANNAYAQGEAVLNPSGDMVTARVAFTSGASYDGAYWKLSASYAPAAHTSSAQAHGVPSGSAVESTVGSQAKLDAHSASSTAHTLLAPAALQLPVNSGSVTDATITALGKSPADGMTVLDTANGLQWTRSLGSWYAVELVTPRAFSPASVPGLFAWYDASQITGLPSGAAVSQWDDLSGNRHHLLQAATPNRPIFLTNQQNGKPAVAFNGTNTNLACIANISHPFMVFAVIKFRANLAANQYALFTSSQMGFASLTPGTQIVALAKGAGNSFNAGSGNNVNDGTAKVLCMQFDPSGTAGGVGFFMRQNGAQGSTAVIANTNTTTSFTLGSSGTAASPTNVMHGHIYEVLIYTGRLTSAQISQVESYLS